MGQEENEFEAFFNLISAIVSPGFDMENGAICYQTLPPQPMTSVYKIGGEVGLGTRLCGYRTVGLHSAASDK